MYQRGRKARLLRQPAAPSRGRTEKGKRTVGRGLGMGNIRKSGRAYRPVSKGEAMTKHREKEIRELIERMVLVKIEAARLGLYQTYHILDDATKKVGWEFAEQVLDTKI